MALEAQPRFEMSSKRNLSYLPNPQETPYGCFPFCLCKRAIKEVNDTFGYSRVLLANDSPESVSFGGQPFPQSSDGMEPRTEYWSC